MYQVPFPSHRRRSTSSGRRYLRTNSETLTMDSVPGPTTSTIEYRRLAMATNLAFESSIHDVDSVLYADEFDIEKPTRHPSPVTYYPDEIAPRPVIPTLPSSMLTSTMFSELLKKRHATDENNEDSDVLPTRREKTKEKEQRRKEKRERRERRERKALERQERQRKKEEVNQRAREDEERKRKTEEEMLLKRKDKGKEKEKEIEVVAQKESGPENETLNSHSSQWFNGGVITISEKGGVAMIHDNTPLPETPLPPPIPPLIQTTQPQAIFQPPENEPPATQLPADPPSLAVPSISNQDEDTTPNIHARQADEKQDRRQADEKQDKRQAEAAKEKFTIAGQNAWLGGVERFHSTAPITVMTVQQGNDGAFPQMGGLVRPAVERQRRVSIEYPKPPLAHSHFLKRRKSEPNGDKRRRATTVPFVENDFSFATSATKEVNLPKTGLESSATLRQLAQMLADHQKQHQLNGAPQDRPKVAASDLGRSHSFATMRAHNSKAHSKKLHSYAPAHSTNVSSSVSALLVFTTQRLDRETERANSAEKQLREVMDMAKEAVKEKEETKRKLTTVEGELISCNIQLDDAKADLRRAQIQIARLDQERIEAESQATKERARARRLMEEKVLREAREEGRRMGYEQGVKNGRMMGWDELQSTRSRRSKPRTRRGATSQPGLQHTSKRTHHRGGSTPTNAHRDYVEDPSSSADDAEGIENEERTIRTTATQARTMQTEIQTEDKSRSRFTFLAPPTTTEARSRFTFINTPTAAGYEDSWTRNWGESDAGIAESEATGTVESNDDGSVVGMKSRRVDDESVWSRAVTNLSLPPPSEAAPRVSAMPEASGFMPRLTSPHPDVTIIGPKSSISPPVAPSDLPSIFLSQPNPVLSSSLGRLPSTTITDAPIPGDIQRSISVPPDPQIIPRSRSAAGSRPLPRPPKGSLGIHAPKRPPVIPSLGPIQTYVDMPRQAASTSPPKPPANNRYPHPLGVGIERSNTMSQRSASAAAIPTTSTPIDAPIRDEASIFPLSPSESLFPPFIPPTTPFTIKTSPENFHVNPEMTLGVPQLGSDNTSGETLSYMTRDTQAENSREVPTVSRSNSSSSKRSRENEEADETFPMRRNIHQHYRSREGIPYKHERAQEAPKYRSNNHSKLSESRAPSSRPLPEPPGIGSYPAFPGGQKKIPPPYGMAPKIIRGSSPNGVFETEKTTKAKAFQETDSHPYHPNEKPSAKIGPPSSYVRPYYHYHQIPPPSAISVLAFTNSSDSTKLSQLDILKAPNEFHVSDKLSQNTLNSSQDREPKTIVERRTMGRKNFGNATGLTGSRLAHIEENIDGEKAEDIVRNWRAANSEYASGSQKSSESNERPSSPPTPPPKVSSSEPYLRTKSPSPHGPKIFSFVKPQLPPIFASSEASHLSSYATSFTDPGMGIAVESPSQSPSEKSSATTNYRFLGPQGTHIIPPNVDQFGYPDYTTPHQSLFNRQGVNQEPHDQSNPITNGIHYEPLSPITLYNVKALPPSMPSAILSPPSESTSEALTGRTSKLVMEKPLSHKKSEASQKVRTTRGRRVVTT